MTRTLRARDLPRHAAVDEGNAADQNGTGPRAALIGRIPLIHRPGSARPQVAYGESVLHIRIAGTRHTGSESVCIGVLLWLSRCERS